MIELKEYYNNPDVQLRIAQYCGDKSGHGDSFSAEYLSGAGGSFNPDRISGEYYYPAQKNSFLNLLKQGVDIFRSVWDQSSTVGILDVEYFNISYPGEAYFNPVRTFYLIEPICARIEKIFKNFGIEYLRIMTGQGYHYSFRVNFQDKVHARLAAAGKLNNSLLSKYNSTKGPLNRPVGRHAGVAFDGMGRLLEYVSHLVLRELGPDYKGIPVVCTDVSPGEKSCEAIALDLSMYGDPLYMRDVRCPFSTYQKHVYLKSRFGDRAAQEVPVFVSLPRPEKYTVFDLLRARTDLTLSTEYAAHISAEIPDASAGIARLIKSYYSSKLYRFHKYFDSQEHDDPSIWPSTYDNFDYRQQLPECVSHCLANPNDNLLKPTNLRMLTAVLLKLDWHPKHIAGLVRSKFERDYGWGTQWFMYDAATRADFYIRLFAGLIAVGIDKQDDIK